MPNQNDEWNRLFNELGVGADGKGRSTEADLDWRRYDPNSIDGPSAEVDEWANIFRDVGLVDEMQVSNHPVDQTKRARNKFAYNAAKVAGIELSPQDMKRWSVDGFSEADMEGMMNRFAKVDTKPQEGLWSGVVRGAEGVFDILQRGEFAVLAGIRSIGDLEVNIEKLFASDSPAEVMDALYTLVEASPPLATLREVFSGVAGIQGQKYDAIDAITDLAPEFAEENPYWTMVLGTALGIAIDPTTYLSFGVAGVAKIPAKGAGIVSRAAGGKALTRAGAKLVRENISSGMTTARAYKAAADTLGSATKTKFAGRVKGLTRETVGDNEIIVTAGAPFTRGEDFVLSIPGVGSMRRAMRGLKESKLGEAAIVKFSRKGTKARMPEEFSEAIEELQRAAKTEERAMEEFAERVLIPLGEEGRNKIGRAMLDARDNTEAFYRTVSDRGMKVKVGDFHFNKIREEAFHKWKLTDAEKSAAMQLMGEFKRMGQLENEAMLLSNMVENYIPLMYNMVKDGKAFTELLGGNLGLYNRIFNRVTKRSKDVRTDLFDMDVVNMTLDDALDIARNKPGVRDEPLEVLEAIQAAYKKAARPKDLPQGLPWAKDRIFKNIAEAQSVGLSPETDALKLYLKRGMSSARARRNAHINSWKTSMLAGEGITPKQINMIEAETKLFGDARLPFERTFSDDFMKAYRQMLGFWKGSATIFRPGFTVRTGVDEFTRGSILAGMRAYKGWDAQSLDIAAQVVGFKTKNPEALKQIVVRNPVGEAYNGLDIANAMRDMEVAQGLATGGVGSRIGIENMIKKVDKGAALGTPAGRGKLAIWKEAAKYWNWPEKLTDFVRTLHMVNGIKLGNDLESAAKRALDLSFDYANGLTKFERSVMTSIVPFYTFNRFAIPALAKAAAQRPAGLATFGRGQEVFFETINKLYNGFYNNDPDSTKLSDTERRSLDGYLLEMPLAFLGMTPQERGRFVAFNNFNLLDTWQMGVFKDDGSIDRVRTFQKTVLAALTPFVKAPVEVFMDQSFFTGRAVSEHSKLMGAGQFHEVLNRTLPEEVKRFVGYEVAENYEGKRTAYLNPYMLFLAHQIFPPMRDIIRFTDTNEEAFTRTLEIFGGTSIYDRDLKMSGQFKKIGFEKRVKEIEREVKKAAGRGQAREIENDFDDLVSLIEAVGGDVQMIDAALESNKGLRGTGLKEREKKFDPTRPPQPPRPDIPKPPTRAQIQKQIKESETIFD